MRMGTISWIVFFVALSGGLAGNMADDLFLLKELNGTEYALQRDAITQRGPSILSDLDNIASNDSDWELSLYASICSERIRRSKDIDALLNYDWKHLPGTESLWEGPLPLTGIPDGLEPFFRQKLLHDSLWYFYLEIYAGKQVTDPWSNYRLLYETIPNFVVDCSQGNIRQIAAQIAEKDVLNKTDGDSCSSEYLNAFSDFVEDGTYPQGQQYFLSHLRLNGHLRTWVLKGISDMTVIEALVSQYSDDPLVQIALNQHLQSLRSVNAHALTSIPKNTPIPLLASPPTETPSEIPVPEVPTGPVEDSPRSSFSVTKIAVIVTVLAGTAFLLLKRRHRP